MGANSTVYIARSVARRLFNKHVGSDKEVTDKKLEAFFDRVLEERLYNCLLADDDSDNLKYNEFRSSITDYELELYLTEYMAANPGECFSSLTAQNLSLRQMLGRVYSGVVTTIDFSKDSVPEIQRKLDEYYNNDRRQWEARQANERG